MEKVPMVILEELHGLVDLEVKDKIMLLALMLHIADMEDMEDHMVHLLMGNKEDLDLMVVTELHHKLEELDLMVFGEDITEML